jgi:hypothetical protein
MYGLGSKFMFMCSLSGRFDPEKYPDAPPIQICEMKGGCWIVADGNNRVGVSVREGIAVAVDDASPFLIAPPDPTGALSLRDLDRARARISEEQRQVILLVALEGFSYQEAATVLGVPIGTIRSRLSRGRPALRDAMDRRAGDAQPANETSVRRRSM